VLLRYFVKSTRQCRKGQKCTKRNLDGVEPINCMCLPSARWPYSCCCNNRCCYCTNLRRHQACTRVPGLIGAAVAVEAQKFGRSCSRASEWQPKPAQGRGHTRRRGPWNQGRLQIARAHFESVDDTFQRTKVFAQVCVSVLIMMKLVNTEKHRYKQTICEHLTQPQDHKHKRRRRGRHASRTWSFVHVGAWLHTRAATPDTCGHAIEVPS
jgi:hypothetical protein